MLTPIRGASLAPTYRGPAEGSPEAAPPPYTSHSISDTLFRCQSRPWHDARADAFGYALLGVGTVLAPVTVGLSLIPGGVLPRQNSEQSSPRFFKD